jgi:molybdenum cofactor guanylyltransferase
MPFVSAPLLSHLRQRSSGNAKAVIPWSSKGAEPLCAWYSASVLEVVAGCLEAPKSIMSCLSGSEVLSISPEEVMQFGDPERIFFSVNSPADLELANQLSRSANR